ncbi:MAG: hypothetical protein U9N57_14575 [Pseudomonadota bacterium]|nr:hypothetical protein [Pseudomonadota bacterium]
MQKPIIKALLIVSALFSSAGYSDESTQQTKSSETEKTPLEQVQNERIQSYLLELSNAQVYIGGYVQSVGEGIDYFFGDESSEVVQKGSRLIVYSPFTFYDNGETVSSLNYRALIDLPKTNHRWKILVSSFEGDEEQNVNSVTNSESLSTTTQNTVSEDSQNTLAGRYLFNASKNTLSHIDLGLKFINYIEPNPYIQYKVRYKKELSEVLQSRTTQKIYLERDRGLAWEGRQIFDYQLDLKWLARSQTSGTWWRDDEEVLINQKAILFEKINSFRARAYFVEGNWNIDNQDALFTSASLGMNWRERVFKDWLFLEAEPRASWYESNNFSEPLYSLRLMLEMHFYLPR